MVKKQAQHTKFDEKVQKEPYQYRRHEQALLFPEHDYQKFEHIPSKNLEHLDLEFPKLDPEHISTKKLTYEQEQRIRDEIEENLRYKNERAYSYYAPTVESDIRKLKEYLEHNKVPDVIKGRILAKYDELRSKSIEFYAKYKEANALAEKPISTDLSQVATYTELFKGFSLLVVEELTKQIGRLFGSFTSEFLSKTLKNGLNIFTITAYNFNQKIYDMNNIIHSMHNVILDFDHRKKLLKQLESKIQKQVEDFLSIEENQQFLLWMDEYFPHYKDDFIKHALQFLRRDGGGNYDKHNVTFYDLVRFRTFKSIYEKASRTSTEGFKEVIQTDLVGSIKQELQSQVKERFKKNIQTLLAFLRSFNDSENDIFSRFFDDSESFISKLIDFCRKKLNIDLRSIITFASNVIKKRIEENIIEQKREQLQEINYKFISNLQENIFSLGKDVADWRVRTIIDNYLETKLGYIDKLPIKELEKIIKLSTKDMDNLARMITYDIIIDCFPGFEEEKHYNPDSNEYFSGIRKLIKKTDGKFSIESVTNFAHTQVPFVPKDILFTTIRSLFRELDNKSINSIFYLSDKNDKSTLQFILKILNREKKLDHNNFLKFFRNLSHYSKLFSTINSYNPKGMNEQDTVEMMVNAVRSIQTLDKDIENLNTFIKFVHDEAGNLPAETVKKMVMNKNFTNFTKTAFVRKLFKAYAQIKNAGGTNNIYKQHGKLITDLKRRKFLGNNFKENLLNIENFFEKNEDISPANPIFNQILQSASNIETDLSVLQMGDALKDLLKDYKQKNKNLFKLDLALNENLRFRVLKDKDPFILRVGIASDCCQRLGGVGETAARDSFINPLASVLILEWKDPNDQEWRLLAQSYFHFVPKENGYILDNVEQNEQNVNKFEELTNLNLEDIYALYASEIKNKLNVNYLLAGKSHSKISESKFKTDKRLEDPRYFDDRALTNRHGHHYSDFDERNSIDLLSPNFDIGVVQQKIYNKSVKESNTKVRNFIKAILNPGKLIKLAQDINQDVRRLQGVNPNLFGQQSWEFINQLINEINASLYSTSRGRELNNQTLNFQTVIRNKSTTTKFTGSIKNLFELSISIWEIISATRQPYSIEETISIIDSWIGDINSFSFPEEDTQNIKPTLVSILTSWKNLLNSLIS